MSTEEIKSLFIKSLGFEVSIGDNVIVFDSTYSKYKNAVIGNIIISHEGASQKARSVGIEIKFSSNNIQDYKTYFTYPITGGNVPHHWDSYKSVKFIIDPKLGDVIDF